MIEVLAFFATNSASLLTIAGIITLLLMVGTIGHRISRFIARMEYTQEVLIKGQGEVKTGQDEIKAEQKAMNSKLDGLVKNTAVLGKTVESQANDLNELRNKQTSDSKEIFDRIVAAEANLDQQSSEIKLGLAQVYKLSNDDLNAFRTENYRSFSFMRDMLGYIRQDIGLIQGILGIYHASSAGSKRYAGA